MKFRILLITSLLLMSVPFFNKAKTYLSEKAHSAKVVGDTAKKFFHYKGDKK